MKMILFHKYQAARCTVVGTQYSVAKEDTQVPGCQWLQIYSLLQEGI